MMRLFCDGCGCELDNRNQPSGGQNSSRLEGERTWGNAADGWRRLKWEVTTGFQGTWNAGHWCITCIIDAVKQKDPRAQVAAGPQDDQGVAGLALRCKADGTWLEFRSRGLQGKVAAIQVESMADKYGGNSVIRAAMLEWCMDRRSSVGMLPLVGHGE